MAAIDPKQVSKLEAKQTSQRSDDVEAVPLATMFGQGEKIILGGNVYEVSPIPIKRLAEAGVIIAKCPDILVTHALVAAINGGVPNVHATAEFLRSAGAEVKDGPQVTDAMIGTALTMGSFNLTDDHVQAMIDLTVFVLQRRHKELTATDIEDEVDVQTFLALMITLFTVDPYMRERFNVPGRTEGE